MKYLFRLLWLVLTASRRSRCPVVGPVDTVMHVWPNDLDIFMHVNNGAYATLMDLGRTDMLLRSDAFHRIRKNGWYPVAASVSLRFRRSLRLGQRFCLRTRVIGWEEKAIYIQQEFLVEGDVIAQGIVDARFLRRGGGTVTADELMEFLDLNAVSPTLPVWLEQWRTSLSDMQDPPAIPVTSTRSAASEAAGSGREPR